MIQTFTPDDVLKSQSGELNTEENALFQVSIEESEDLKAFAEVADSLEHEMENLIETPSERPFHKIMAFLENRKKQDRSGNP